ncbi:DUF4087 domain-containing protein [Ideonella sp. A 288]|uniref:DUF4087 domain-containing protein n=1 Tax=Ideonella sp. A 288 TaxID=1962181 RepID=UPI000B4BA14E|nr:DUF4087 domain-containing protein [Ideonella sp. A 288]
MRPRSPAIASAAGPRAWLRRLAVPLLAGAAATAMASSAPPDAVTRCGWFDNPTPGNATLTDRDGEWTIGLQGGHQAKGDWPKFKPGQWVRTGTGSAGYGCACLKVKADAASQEVSVIVSSRTQALGVCRKDKALHGLEPQNPLK